MRENGPKMTSKLSYAGIVAGLPPGIVGAVLGGAVRVGPRGLLVPHGFDDPR